ncbi:hypothetical protein PR202_gb03370 [Eleusine coracana subsp. coracana]|uniref:BTB domain-containing protein n=1 Tax=Eleusine coracana subsp. coracana TaxID=191504 RepID=A0AAV5E102_ELECO|nr:hypothetical protein PR202_gb03370 [Eleusine coracana subsp. coracana]
MQDCVGKFVEFNIDLAAAESRLGGVAISKDLSFNGDVWRVQCYPRGAAGDDGAGEYLSVHLVNRSTARSGRILFEAMVLGRGAGGAEAAAASVHRVFQRTLDYPKDTARLPLTRVFRTRDLAELCAVHGYVTIVCGVVVLRHSPIPVPPSTLLHDLRGLEVQNRYGTPDVTIAVVDGQSVDVNRSVLSARSPVLKKILDDAAAVGNNNELAAIVQAKPDPSDGSLMEEDSITVDGEKEEAAVMTDCVKPSPAKITIDALRGLQAWTFYALLVYIYCDRLPRDKECCGAPVTTELLRDLLAAADRYRLHRLKLMCAKKLWEDVSVETVSKTLWYAHQYNCRELKNACMNFIAVAGNSYRVMLTNEWHWLGQESPGIINEFKQRATTKYI